MNSLVNYALFQGVWFAAVWGAGEGRVHLGFLAALAMLAVHVAMVPRPGRGRELAYVLGFGLVGAAVDSGLRAAGLIAYPTSGAWAHPTAPPWILGLWLGFAMLPRFSLAWLCPRPALAAVLGAIGGPLSFLAGTRFGSIEPISNAAYLALAVEYAALTALMMRLAPRAPRAA